MTQGERIEEIPAAIAAEEPVSASLRRDSPDPEQPPAPRPKRGKDNCAQWNLERNRHRRNWR